MKGEMNVDSHCVAGNLNVYNEADGEDVGEGGGTGGNKEDGQVGRVDDYMSIVS